MSYQVLARKWRPRSFKEMVGQEHVLQALINALDNDRLHHAFLFTGTRGVGKTTVARILAKSINCEQGVSSNPCGECGACREIDEGRFIDLIEVDAASRTKVEDTRELLENVQYAPTRGRYKVYLIDEVHMLSNHSFNALLKTLEEPPPHVKFLLATTDPQKLPVTILSRCLQFSLKHLPVRLIVDHMAYVLGQEQVEFENAALLAVARAADGSMRDALSLLDQAIAHGGGSVSEREVSAMLGSIEQHFIVHLLQALIAGDGQQLLEEVQRLAEQAPDFGQVLSELLSLIHRVAMAQVVPGAIDDTLGDKETVLALAQAAVPEDIQLFYQIGLIGRRDLPLAPDPRSGLEMVLLRMLAFRPAQSGSSPQSRGTENRGGQDRDVQRPAASPRMANTALPQAGTRQARQEPVAVSTPAPSASTSSAADVAQAIAETPAPAAAATSPVTVSGDNDWAQIVEQIGVKAVARELAVRSVLDELKGHTCKLILDPAFEQIKSDSAVQRLEQALQRYYNDAALKLDIRVAKPTTETPAQQRDRLQAERQQDAVASMEQDSVVQDIQQVFNAELNPDLVQPNE
jgi:DNA polymerase-3 subunit gamma/tau